MTDTWEDAVRWYRETASETDIRANYMDVNAAEAALRFRGSPEFRRTARLFRRRAGHLVDLGAGWGVSSVAFALAGWRVTAIEPDPSDVVGAGAIERLASDLDVSVAVECASGEAIPLPDGSADVVYGRQVLHHVRDLDQTMAEVARILVQGGRAIFVREHVAESEAELGAFLKSHPLHDRYGGENALPRSSYLGAGAQAGLRIEKVLLPLETVINTFPRTRSQRARAMVAAGIRGMPRGRTVSRRERLLGENEPGGRLYSFVWIKP